MEKVLSLAAQLLIIAFVTAGKLFPTPAMAGGLASRLLHAYRAR